PRSKRWSRKIPTCVPRSRAPRSSPSTRKTCAGRSKPEGRHARAIARGDRPPHFGAAPSRTLEGCPHGPAALGGACQAVLLPQLRADLCAAPRVRDRGDPRACGAEVRVPELLLFAYDRCGLVRGAPLRGVGGFVCWRDVFGLIVR